MRKPAALINALGCRNLLSYQVDKPRASQSPRLLDRVRMLRRLHYTYRSQRPTSTSIPSINILGGLGGLAVNIDVASLGVSAV
jgi:hypothetical protein